MYIRVLMLYSTSNTQAMKALLLILPIFVILPSSLQAQGAIWDLSVGNKFIYRTYGYWNNDWRYVYSMKEVIREESINGQKYSVLRYKLLGGTNRFSLNVNPLDEDSLSFVRVDGSRLYQYYQSSRLELVFCDDSLTVELNNSSIYAVSKDTAYLNGQAPLVALAMRYIFLGSCPSVRALYASPFGLIEKRQSCSRSSSSKDTQLESAWIDGKLYGDSLIFQRFVSGSSPTEDNANLAPNPFTTDLSIIWNQNTQADAEIIDIVGRTVKQLSLQPFTLNYWDGKESNGLPVSIGLYWLRIKTATTTSVVKILKTP